MTAASDHQIELMKSFWSHYGDAGSPRRLRTFNANILKRDFLSLIARIEELQRFLFPYANNKEISGISWDGNYLIGDKKSITAFHTLKNRGEQIDVYKRAYDQNEAALKARIKELEKLLGEKGYIEDDNGNKGWIVP